MTTSKRNFFLGLLLAVSSVADAAGTGTVLKFVNGTHSTFFRVEDRLLETLRAEKPTLFRIKLLAAYLTYGLTLDPVNDWGTPVWINPKCGGDVTDCDVEATDWIDLNQPRVILTEGGLPATGAFTGVSLVFKSDQNSHPHTVQAQSTTMTAPHVGTLGNEEWVLRPPLAMTSDERLTLKLHFDLTNAFLPTTEPSGCQASTVGGYLCFSFFGFAPSYELKTAD